MDSSKFWTQRFSGIDFYTLYTNWLLFLKKGKKIFKNDKILDFFFFFTFTIKNCGCEIVPSWSRDLDNFEYFEYLDQIIRINFHIKFQTNFMSTYLNSSKLLIHSQKYWIQANIANFSTYGSSIFAKSIFILIFISISCHHSKKMKITKSSEFKQIFQVDKSSLFFVF